MNMKEMFLEDQSNAHLNNNELPLLDLNNINNNNNINITNNLLQNTEYNTLGLASTNSMFITNQHNFEYVLQDFNVRDINSLKTTIGLQTFGYFFLGFAFVSGLMYIYAVFLSKLLPLTGFSWFDVIAKDHFFIYFIPLAIIPSYIIIYLNWLTINHFKQN